jgi:uncharacterized protein involved in type VI secretion and phage assembly
MTRRYGVTTGHVLQVHDDKGQGRVLVSMDRLATDGPAPEGYWAPVATPMAGPKRGAWFMPEVGDEVLIAFDDGDVNHPFVLGFLWNGQQTPPTKDEHLRRLQTVAGHTLDFHDKEGEHQIVLTSVWGHSLTLDDKNDVVTLATKEGDSSLTLDRGQGAIKLQFKDGLIGITLDQTGEVQIQTSGKITVTCGQLEVTAAETIDLTATASVNITAPSVGISAGILDVQAAMSSFEGVVQTATTIAAAVVGSAYTPAPGDTLGL